MLVVVDYVAIPRPVIEHNKIVTMTVDVLFVDIKSFLIMKSRRTRFVTAEHVPIRTAKNLSKHLSYPSVSPSRIISSNNTYG
jgi:hypothetical protein